MSEKEFLEKIIPFLENKFRFDCSQPEFILDDGDNSVLMKGEFAGYSLASLKQAVAKLQGKPYKFVNRFDDYYVDENIDIDDDDDD